MAVVIGTVSKSAAVMSYLVPIIIGLAGLGLIITGYERNNKDSNIYKDTAFWLQGLSFLLFVLIVCVAAFMGSRASERLLSTQRQITAQTERITSTIEQVGKDFGDLSSDIQTFLKESGKTLLTRTLLK